MTLRRSLPLAALATLAVAAPAQASPTPADFQRDVAVAADYWHQTAPCGAPTMQLDSTDVRTESGAPAGGWVSAIGATDCVIHVRDTPTNDWGTDQQGLCVLVGHEYGHLLGLGHTKDPGGLMFDGPSLIPPVGCRPASEPAPVARVRTAHRHHRRHVKRLRAHQ